MAGKLFVVGTPIGNLDDFSKRGIDTLNAVDFIAAEDTRVTLKLLNRFNIKKPMISYHEHNKNTASKEIFERLFSGENGAIVTDAGMPCISDPGEDLVRQSHENGIEVVCIPGPSAVTSALAVSGEKSGRFCFEGFLSVNKISRKKHLEEVKDEKRTLIFYEAPHKLVATLKDMEAVFGNRKITLLRELTKIHEEIIKTDLKEAISKFTESVPKGEFVLIIEGAKEEKKEFSLDDAVKIAKDLIKKGEKATVAAKEAASVTGRRKSEIYKQII